MSDTARRDVALVEGVAQGDEAALEGVFEEFGSTVRSVALRVVRDEALAEDVVQETFLSFWRDPRRFDPHRGSLGSFLVTVAHRRAVDVVRSEVARTRREQAPPDRVHVDVEEEVWSRDVSRTVREALAALPDPEREPLTLAYLQGMSYVQVASRLGLPEGTVKSRIRSGMRKLSRSLAALA